MKFIFTSLMFASLIAKSGGFIFPNVEYSYAKLYLFNTEKPSAEYFYDFNIYKDGIYANSKIGNGWEVSQDMNNQLNSILRTGVDLLVAGLSGCYIPRHGIIYFDAKGTPVASMSACFECDRISFWSSQALPPAKEITKEATKKELASAEKQIASMINLLEKNGIPVFESELEYSDYAKTNEQYKVDGEMIFDYTKTNYPSKFEKAYTKEMVSKWQIPGAYLRLSETFATDFKDEQKKSPYNFMKLVDQGGTWFSFSSDQKDAIMVEAYINNSGIRLPNGLSVGMSLEDVQGSFELWDGNAYPASIIVTYQNFIIRYSVENRTLTQIHIVAV